MGGKRKKDEKGKKSTGGQKGKRKFGLLTKGSLDYPIWITVMILVAFGLIMVLSASAPSALSETGDSSERCYAVCRTYNGRHGQ